jgi:hypothetical protein
VVRIDQIGLGGALVFDQNGASVSISFEITNIGTAPAINIMPYAWLLIFKQGGRFPSEEQQRRCAEIRQKPFGFGFTLFPGEHFPSKLGFGSWSTGVNISLDEIENGLIVNADRTNILLYVIGCIDYTFPSGDAIHHQTRFILELRKNPPDIFICPDEGQIPVASLSLKDLGIGMGHYAD